MKIMASSPITSWKIVGETMETVTNFVFLGSKITAMVIAAMKLKDAHSLNINNLRYADDTPLMAESEEELKSLLMKVKEESKNLAQSSTFRKLRSWYLVPSLHGK